MSGWGGCSLVSGIAATAMSVFSFDTTAAYLLSKRHQVLSPKVSGEASGAIGGIDEVYIAWGWVTRTVGISSSSYRF